MCCQPGSSSGDVLHKLRAAAKPGHQYGAEWLRHPLSLLGVHQCLPVLIYDLKISVSNVFSRKTRVEHEWSRRGRNELRLLNRHPWKIPFDFLGGRSGRGRWQQPPPGGRRMLWVVKIQVQAVPEPHVGHAPFVCNAQMREAISPSSSGQIDGEYNGEESPPARPSQPEITGPGFSYLISSHTPCFVDGWDNLFSPLR